MLPKQTIQEEHRLVRGQVNSYLLARCEQLLREQGLEDLLARYSTQLKELARKLSNQTRQPKFYVEEFYEAAVMGFIEAATEGNFDPEKGVSFWAYAFPFALNEIKACQRQYNLVQFSATATKRWNQIKQGHARLAEQLQREPTAEEVAEALGLDVFYVREVLQANRRYEEPRGGGESAGALLDERQLQQALEAPLDPPRADQDLVRHRQRLLALAEYSVGRDAALAWMILEILYRDLARDQDKRVSYEGETEDKPDRDFWQSIASDLANLEARIGQPSGEDGISAWEILCQGYPEAIPRNWAAVCALFAQDRLPLVQAENLKRWRSRIRRRVMSLSLNSRLLLEDIEGPAYRNFKQPPATAFHPDPQITTQDEPNGEALEALEEAYKEFLEDNWDGYGASAVSESTYKESQRFLQLLPTNFPLPEITADPDGAIAFDWYKEPRRTLSVSVGSDKLLSYAGLFGINKAHGTEYFGDDLPATILSNLRRLFA